MNEYDVVEVVDWKNGIVKVTVPSHQDAEELCKVAKKDYPYAIINGTGYYSNIYILNLYKQWGDLVTTIEDEDGKCTCINCHSNSCQDGVKKPHRNSSPGILSAPERCFMEQFWAEVVQEAYRHFIDESGNVYAITNAQSGGFGGTIYDIFFEDGDSLLEVGLWHRGHAPDCVQKYFRKGRREARRR